MKKLFLMFAFWLGLTGNAIAERVTGPLQTPLKIHRMYYTGGNLFVAFQSQPSSPMPNCYGDAGGYLRKSHPDFDGLYAQLLTIMATGGIRGHILFDSIYPGGGGWSDCDIAGFYLFPQ